MKVLTIFLCFTRISGFSQIQYKLLSLDDTQWPGYISQTIPYKTNTNIECGALCSAQFYGECNLYAQQKDSKTCHIGYFDNTDTGYLKDQSGLQPVYISLSKLSNTLMHVLFYYLLFYCILSLFNHYYKKM